MRDRTGHDSNAMTTTVDQIPDPTMEASTRRKITGGSVIARSTLRMEMASAQEPPKAEMAPTKKPMAVDRTTEETATSSEMRPPSSVRASTSRPTPSVPNQCFHDGAAFMANRSMSLGL